MRKVAVRFWPADKPLNILRDKGRAFNAAV